MWLSHRIIWSWYTGRWWVGCYFWYSEEGTGRGRSLPRRLFAVPNVTANQHSAIPSTDSVPNTVLLYNGTLLCDFNERKQKRGISEHTVVSISRSTGNRYRLCRRGALQNLRGIHFLQPLQQIPFVTQLGFGAMLRRVNVAGYIDTPSKRQH